MRFLNEWYPKHGLALNYVWMMKKQWCAKPLAGATSHKENVCPNSMKTKKILVRLGETLFKGKIVECPFQVPHQLRMERIMS